MTSQKLHNRPAGPSVFLVLGVCTLMGACSWIPKGETALDVGVKDRGIASWYGQQFHGKLAANGEVFDMEALTAAHRTLPLGSVVRVVNLANGKHVRVRITDRGPYVSGRILDLSYAAATRLDMVERGVSVVQVEVIGDHRPEYFLSFDPEMRSRVPLITDVPRPDHRLAVAAIPSLVRPDRSAIKAVRQFPGDVLHQRRSRRIPAILAADHIAHAEVAAFVLA